jgi:acyl-coenzyme A synthetase/AMP-(fatty) acid ligase
LDRSTDYVALILAAWRAGFFVVPLNTAWPLEKNLEIIQRIKPTVVIVGDEFDMCVDNKHSYTTVSTLRGVSIENARELRPLKSSDVAYVIFTSGSTGEPKGVVISAASYRSYIDWTRRRFSNYADSKKLLLTSELTFDITMGDIAFALAFGTDIGVAKNNTNIPSILAMIMEYEIDVLYSVPTTHLALTTFAKRKRGADLTSLKLILSGGDRFPWQLVKDYQNLAQGVHFFNVYGPTEVTINCFSVRLDNKDHLMELQKTVPIGHCFDSLEYVLLDEEERVSDEGELCIAGPQVMQGYFGDEKLTELSMVSDPRTVYAGKSFYRTGDLAYVDGGDVFLKGRKDGLVKIRGYRVHPDEVSKALDGISDILVSACVAYGVQSEAALAVFIKVRAGSQLKETEVKLFLESKLPVYMVPSKIIFVDDFPLNRSGKIDKNVLIKRLL